MTGTGKRGVDLKTPGHACPINGPGGPCGTHVDADKLLCGPHWHMVPEPLARAVYRAWNHGHGSGTTEHWAACEAAIGSVERRLAAGGKQ